MTSGIAISTANLGLSTMTRPKPEIPRTILFPVLEARSPLPFVGHIVITGNTVFKLSSLPYLITRHFLCNFNVSCQRHQHFQFVRCLSVIHFFEDTTFELSMIYNFALTARITIIGLLILKPLQLCRVLQ